jgi:hypothetical protein
VVIEKQIITVIFEPRFLPKIAAIWDVAPCSLVDITLMLAAVSISDISLSVYNTKLRNIAEDSHLHTPCENWNFTKILLFLFVGAEGLK